MKKQSKDKPYTGDKQRIYEYVKEHGKAKTSELVEKLGILPKRVWELTNELEEEGTVTTTK